MSFAGIQATVLQKNIEQFFCDACGNYGKTMNIPCGATVVDISPETYWAVPEKKGYVQGFTYEIADSAPTYDSIQVFKLTDKTTGEWYWVVGTQEAYFVACAACCDASPSPTIVTSTRNSFTSDQYICEDSDGNFYGYWAAPPLGAGRYVSVVSKDGEQQTPAQTYSDGSTSLANLITYLNSNYSAVGVWSLQGSPSSIRLAATEEGSYGFVVCSKTS